MAKRSGLGMSLHIGGINVSNDIGAINQISSPRATIENTGIDKLAFERLLTTKDGVLTLTAHWNPTLAHTTFRGLPTADVMATIHLGSAIGDTAASLVAKQTNYDGSRAQDGSFPFAVNMIANGYGLEWGNLITAGIRTDATATNGASHDG